MIAPCFSKGKLKQLARVSGEEDAGYKLSLMLDKSTDQTGRMCFVTNQIRYNLLYCIESIVQVK